MKPPGGAELDPLAEIRLIFREELEDHLVLLERERDTLARPGADPAALRAAVAEIYRAVHGLKGAARAVDYRGIEQLCHALEAHLAPVRHASAPDAAGVAAVARVAEDALRVCAGDLAAGRLPSERALLDARQKITSGPGAPPPLVEVSEGVASKAASQAAISALPSGEEPGGRDSGGPRPITKPEPSAPQGRAPETVRVSVARLGELLSTSEEMLALAGRRGGAAARFKSLDEALTELRDELRRARQAARAEGLDRAPGGEEVLRRIDRGIVVLQALGAWSLDQQRDDAATWQAATSLAGEVAERSRALRVVPFGSLQPALERAAQDAADAVGKEIIFVLRGGAVEIDRRVRDGLREPLLHLLRNAVDHGLESPAVRTSAGKPAAGRIEVVATMVGRDLHVTLDDEGAGIDLDAVRAVAIARGAAGPAATQAELLSLLFEPGFTTRPAVTSISGRGIGLDVVRQRVAEMHGRVEVESHTGRGTRFTLVMPLDLSVVRGLIVRVRDIPCVVVTTAILRLRRVSSEDIRAVEGRLYLQEPSGLTPLADLDVVLGFSRGARPRAAEAGPSPCVILAAGDRRVALRVDALLEERDVVVRPLGARVRRAAFVAGATVLGDGEVAPVLDVADLVRLTRPAPSPEIVEAPRRRRLLVVDDSVTTRQLERSILEAAGYEVSVARDGQEAWEQLAGDASFDLIVSDVEMPRLDGFQLVARVRGAARTARLPVVLVTALDSDADRRRAIEVGASAYVVKGGFDQEALLETLEQLL